MLPPATVNGIVPNIRLHEGIDFLQAGKNVVYTSRLRSQISKSGFSKIIQTPFKKTFMVRNRNTTKKLLELINYIEMKSTVPPKKVPVEPNFPVSNHTPSENNILKTIFVFKVFGIPLPPNLM
jgi:hypothetical protein